MALFDGTEDFFSIERGKTIHLPISEVKGSSVGNDILIKNLALHMKKTNKNFLPIIVKEIEENQYESCLNTPVLEAARLANLDLIWCIIVDNDMFQQIEIEAGKVIRIPLLSASEDDIIDLIEYVKKDERYSRSINKLDSQKAAKAIIKKREENTLYDLNFLTDEKCGFGKKAVSIFLNYFPIEIKTHEIKTINLLSATENDIINLIESVKKDKKYNRLFSKLDSQKAAKAIIKKREENLLSSLSFLTKEKCGFGQRAISIFKNYFLIEN